MSLQVFGKLTAAVSSVTSSSSSNKLTSTNENVNETNTSTNTIVASITSSSVSGAVVANGSSSSSDVLKVIKDTEGEKMSRLIQTFNRYEKIIKTAVNIFEMMFDWEKKMSEGYSKMNGDIQAILITNNDNTTQDNIATKDETQIRLENYMRESIAFHEQRILEHQATITFFQNQVLAGLRSLHSQVKQKSLDFSKEWSTVVKSLEKDVHARQKLESQLAIAIEQVAKQQATAVEANNEDSSYTSPSTSNIFEASIKDPWLISYTLSIHLNETQSREAKANMTINTMIQQMAVFERLTITRVKDLLKSFYDWQSKSGQSYHSQVARVKSSVDGILESSDLQNIEINLIGSASTSPVGESLKKVNSFVMGHHEEERLLLDEVEYEEEEEVVQGNETKEKSENDMGQQTEKAKEESNHEHRDRTESEKTLVNDKSTVNVDVKPNATTNNMVALTAKYDMSMKGPMQRLVTNLFKKDEYKAGMYVLTESGFLHSFEWTNDDSIQGEVKNTYYLPSCTVSEKDGHYLIQERLRSIKIQPIDNHATWRKTFTPYLSS